MGCGVAEVSEKCKETNGGELDGSLGDFAAFIIAKVIEDEIEVGLHFFEPKAFFEVILETAIMPAGEIGPTDGDTVFANFRDDGVVGETVVEHGIDHFAQFLGEPGDIAVATADGSLLGVAARMIGIRSVHGFEDLIVMSLGE